MKDTKLQPFGKVSGSRYVGRVIVDARKTTDTPELRKWIDCVVVPRMGPGARLEVWQSVGALPDH